MAADERRYTPELEALIIQRMKSGGFDHVEEALLPALKTSSPAGESSETSRDKRTGTDLIAASQASPYRELEIEPSWVRLSAVRDIVLRWHGFSIRIFSPKSGA